MVSSVLFLLHFALDELEQAFPPSDELLVEEALLVGAPHPIEAVHVELTLLTLTCLMSES